MLLASTLGHMCAHITLQLSMCINRERFQQTGTSALSFLHSRSSLPTAGGPACALRAPRSPPLGEDSFAPYPVPKWACDSWDAEDPLLKSII